MDLEISPRTRGRAALPLTPVKVRDLSLSDLGLLSSEKGSEAPNIKRISNRHHTLARLLASGMGPGEAAIVAGYSASRISILQDDPLFKDLVTFYKKDVDAQYLDMHERIAGLSVDALEELRQRLEEEPDSFSNGMLLDIMTKTADRSGNGPTSTSTQVNVNVNLADRLEAARKRVAEYRIQTIEGTSNEQDDESGSDGSDS